jgi:transposase
MSLYTQGKLGTKVFTLNNLRSRIVPLSLGIDIAKKKFDAALLRDGKFKTKVFENTPAGFSALSDWLQQHGVDKAHACMEATGILYEGLAVFLADAGHDVSVVNPLQIKAFGESLLSRTKNDKADARLIARFCEAISKPSRRRYGSPIRRKFAS